jgi:hypothetical protein
MTLHFYCRLNTVKLAAQKRTLDFFHPETIAIEYIVFFMYSTRGMEILSMPMILLVN